MKSSGPAVSIGMCGGVAVVKQWLNCLAVTKTFFFFFDDQQGKRESRPRSRLLSQVFALISDTQFSPYKHNRAYFPIQTDVHHLHEHKQPACLSGTVVEAVAAEITLRFWAKQRSRPTSWMWKLVVGNAAEFGYWNPKQGASISYWRQHLLCLKAQSEPRNIHFRVYNKKTTCFNTWFIASMLILYKWILIYSKVANYVAIKEDCPDAIMLTALLLKLLSVSVLAYVHDGGNSWGIDLLD